MPTAAEAAGTQGTPLSGALAAGVRTLSYDQTVTFTRYVKLVLPTDGSVFWVKADLLSPSAVVGSLRLGGAPLGTAATVATQAPTVVASGSLHYATDLKQEESQTYTVNQVVFTSLEEVVDLNAIGPTLIYVATVDGVRFAFSQRGYFYAQSGLYHYRGAAVYSDLATQLVDAVDGFDFTTPVVSNSLPLWLGLNGWNPLYGGLVNDLPPLYPSFLTPPNDAPPFISVHVEPDATASLVAAPLLGPTLTHDQLCRDRVRLTTYGLRNDRVTDLIDLVLQYAGDTERFGIMSVPAVRDGKRAQVELRALSQQKLIDFEVSYLQSRARDVARQLILKAVPTLYVGDQPVAA